MDLDSYDDSKLNFGCVTAEMDFSLREEDDGDEIEEEEETGVGNPVSEACDMITVNEDLSRIRLQKKKSNGFPVYTEAVNVETQEKLKKQKKKTSGEQKGKKNCIPRRHLSVIKVHSFGKLCPVSSAKKCSSFE